LELHNPTSKTKDYLAQATGKSPTGQTKDSDSLQPNHKANRTKFAESTDSIAKVNYSGLRELQLQSKVLVLTNAGRKNGQKLSSEPVQFHFHWL